MGSDSRNHYRRHRRDDGGFADAIERPVELTCRAVRMHVRPLSWILEV
jgi:hypothetical protein